MTGGTHPFAVFIRTLGRGKKAGRDLSREEACAAMDMILEGTVEPVQLGAFLMLLRLREETPEEVAGMVEAVRRRLPQGGAPGLGLDWPSYAGKRRRAPWFVLAQVLLAENGVPVLVHGRRGEDPERVYTETVFRALGLPCARSLQEAAACLDREGLCYLPLSGLCAELDALFDLRSLLGLRSPVNTVARMINPLRLPSIQGIFHPGFAAIHQRAAALLGDRVASFRGDGGEGEIRPDGETQVFVNDGGLCELSWAPLLAQRVARPAHWSLEDLCRLWRGTVEDPYGEAAVISTAALALWMVRRADSMESAQETARAMWRRRDPLRLPEVPLS